MDDDDHRRTASVSIAAIYFHMTLEFIATSLDGYIAGPDGAIDWLEQATMRGINING